MIAGLVFIIYKLGEKGGKKSVENKSDECDEETYIVQLINELKTKKNKTNKDKDNLSLLEIKLQQIQSKK